MGYRSTVADEAMPSGAAAEGPDAPLVEVLVDAQTQGRILPQADVDLPLERAYAVQHQVRSVRVARGDRVAGHKIGLTSATARAPWGASEPVSGHLLASTVVEDAATFSLTGLANPRVEAEIAFWMRSPLSGEHLTPEDVIAATSHVVIALEIVASRWAGGPSTLGLLVADNVNASGVILGRSSSAAADLDELVVEIQVASSRTHGAGSQVFGHPARAVAWLAKQLTRFGEQLRAGDLVMSGSLNVPVPVSPGDRLTADFGSLGTLTTTFAS